MSRVFGSMVYRVILNQVCSTLMLKLDVLWVYKSIPFSNFGISHEIEGKFWKNEFFFSGI